MRTREAHPISILYSTTGPYAALGREALAGALAAIAEVNADNDLPFRLEPRIDDPAGRAEFYPLRTEAAIRNHGCRHVIGTITSWSRKDVLPAIERNGALLWYAFPYEGYEASDSAIYLGACPNQHLLPLFDHVLPRFGNRPFIVGSNYIWGWENSRIARELTEASGGQVLSERFVPLGAVEVDHLITEIEQKRPDFILSNLVGASATAFFAAYDLWRRNRPAAPPIVGCNLSETELDSLTPEARAGHIAAAPYFNRLDIQENREFKARMAARYGAERRITTSFCATYMSVTILAQAMKDAATDAPDAIRRVVTSRSFDTPMGPVAIHPRTHHAALRPHLAVSDTSGEFDIFHSAAEPVEADPYLVHAFHRPKQGDGDSHLQRQGSHLKVVK
ncbi:transporter substrate-binding protein [Rhizobium sp. AG855]|uniref:transporter substrate-binding protein n=1 Tax=Rhizobium sp. AG855 TaxID=2183898 RepID=UPI000E73CB8A|nr:transporter substrate-binding protein [Rhizobium sp. AG855]RKE77535.1 amino acid/amide ABC transporter substrate-binding protein (HAAT family) [Rhizobium sp. AG855]